MLHNPWVCTAFLEPFAARRQGRRRSQGEVTLPSTSVAFTTVFNCKPGAGRTFKARAQALGSPGSRTALLATVRAGAGRNRHHSSSVWGSSSSMAPTRNHRCYRISRRPLLDQGSATGDANARLRCSTGPGPGPGCRPLLPFYDVATGAHTSPAFRGRTCCHSGHEGNLPTMC